MTHSHEGSITRVLPYRYKLTGMDHIAPAQAAHLAVLHEYVRDVLACYAHCFTKPCCKAYGNLRVEVCRHFIRY